MGQQLGHRSFVYEPAIGIQDAGDFYGGITRMLDVIANAEVNPLKLGICYLPQCPPTLMFVITG